MDIGINGRLSNTRAKIYILTNVGWYCVGWKVGIDGIGIGELGIEYPTIFNHWGEIG